MSEQEPDFQIGRTDADTPVMTDTERRDNQRRVARERRRRLRQQRRAPWYTVLIVLVLLIVSWLAAGGLLGIEARNQINDFQRQQINSLQTQEADSTGTAVAGLSADSLTATHNYVLDLATGTAQFAATATPTITPTPTVTPTPTAVGGTGGHIVYVSEEGGDAELILYNVLSGERRALTINGADESSPVWSPDGRLIAYSSTAAGGGRHIFVLDPFSEGAEPLQLTFGIRVDTFPQWAPDSERIAYRSREGVRSFIRVVDLAGNTVEEIQFPNIEELLEWSPDGGTFTYFGIYVEGVFEMLAFPVGSTESIDRVPITDAFGDVQWINYSPDRSQVVFTANAREPAPRSQVFLADGTCAILNAEDCILQRVTSDDNNYTQPNFSPDGTLLVVSADIDGNQDLFLMDLEGRIQSKITQTGFADYDPDWQPIP